MIYGNDTEKPRLLLPDAWQGEPTYHELGDERREYAVNLDGGNQEKAVVPGNVRKICRSAFRMAVSDYLTLSAFENSPFSIRASRHNPFVRTQGYSMPP